MQKEGQGGAGALSDELELYLEGFWKWSDMKRRTLQKDNLAMVCRVDWRECAGNGETTYMATSFSRADVIRV